MTKKEIMDALAESTGKRMKALQAMDYWSTIRETADTVRKHGTLLESNYEEKLAKQEGNKWTVFMYEEQYDFGEYRYVIGFNKYRRLDEPSPIHLEVYC